MPLPFHAHGIRAVAHLQSEGDDVIASPALWTALKAHMRFARRRENTEERDEERIGISVQWREDRRLGKGKAKSVVAWVIQAEERVSTGLEYSFGWY